jgi:hypothetical protein
MAVFMLNRSPKLGHSHHHLLFLDVTSDRDEMAMMAGTSHHDT